MSFLNERYRICEDHFPDWCFMNLSNKSRLVHNAVPTFFQTDENSDRKLYPASTVSLDANVTDDQSPSLNIKNDEMKETNETNSTIPIKESTLKCLKKSSTGRKKFTPTKSKLAKLIKKKNDLLQN